MRVECLGSESKGNLYLLISDKGEVLIIEAGIHIKEVKKALGFDLSNVVGCIVTHAHGDHSKYIKEFTQSGIDCYTNQHTITEKNLHDNHRVYKIHDKWVVHLGAFTIIAFPVVHTVPCNGFLIQHPESGKILFATDAAYIPHKFATVNHLLIEANYSDEAMSNNHGVGAHMALDTCLNFIQDNYSPSLRNVVLLHLSATNSDEKKFISEVKNIAPIADVTVADKGVTINLNINHF